MKKYLLIFRETCCRWQVVSLFRRFQTVDQAAEFLPSIYFVLFRQEGRWLRKQLLLLLLLMCNRIQQAPHRGAAGGHALGFNEIAGLCYVEFIPANLNFWWNTGEALNPKSQN